MWARNIILFVEGTIENRNPHSLWISGFFFPQGLLAAISQNYARKYHTSIDSLEFKYQIQNNIYDDSDLNVDALFENNEKYSLENKNAQEDGILIFGFYIDGGKWDREHQILLDSPLRFTQLPHFLCKLIHVRISKKPFNILTL